MKLIRLFDIILQVILLLIPLYILLADGRNEPIGYALIGLWQLFSFLIISWQESKLYLRLIYFLCLTIVFLPAYYDNNIITDAIYYNYICPAVAIYYLIVCIVEYIQLDKVSTKNTSN